MDSPLTPGQIIGRNLRTVRAKKLFSQQDLADHSGVAKITIGKLETGEIARPRRKTIEKMARVLGVTVEDLLREEPTGPKAGPLPTPEQPELNGFTQEISDAPAWQRSEDDFLAWLRGATPAEVEQAHREVSDLLGDYQERYYFQEGTPPTDSPEWRRLRLLHRREAQFLKWRKYLDEERAPQDEAKLAELRGVA